MGYQFTHEGTVYDIAAGTFTATPVPHPIVARSVGDEPYYVALTGAPDTLVVFLHAWSGAYNEVLAWPQLANIPNTVLVAPNFGGPNNHPQGAGHPAQLERIKRVTDKAIADYGCSRLIVCGYSGGGYASLMMLGAYPGLFQGAVAWFDIHDLAAWWEQVPGERASIEACFGGTPAQLPQAYHDRSPIGVLENARDCSVILAYAPDDAVVPPSHQLASHALLSQIPSINIAPLVSVPGGHVFDATRADVLASQIRSLIAEGA
jgi:pimeloyl-ACP methyl ester carboxylesterase